MLTKLALSRTNLSSVTLCVCMCVCVCVCVCMCVSVCVVVGSSHFVIYVGLHNVVQQTKFTLSIKVTGKKQVRKYD